MEDIYSALISASEKSDITSLNEEEAIFLEMTLASFRRNGMGKNAEDRKEISRLQKEMSDLATQFEQNINEDVTTVRVTRDDLEGLSQAFLASLSADESGDLTLGMKV